jgi:phage tail protein X
MALNITSFDYVTVQTEGVTVDLLCWKLYRQRTRGVLEATLDSNPHLAKIHRETPFLPVGTQVRIPIDPDVFAGRPQPVVTSTIAGNIV